LNLNPGKSTLINGIIDEVPADPESVVLTKGKVAYVAQTPFILNTTLRANILFGLPFEEDVYDRVLDACCLRQDIEQLGDFGDLVEIGERGVTLSGGR
jgi:ATP-binding cassette subfamily C (CFTR/MRP) protein 1